MHIHFSNDLLTSHRDLPKLLYSYHTFANIMKTVTQHNLKNRSFKG